MSKPSYMGALIDAGIRTLGITGGALAGHAMSPSSSNPLVRSISAGAGGAIGHNVASNILQRMDRNMYVQAGPKGTKPVKLRKNVSETYNLNEFDLSKAGLSALAQGMQNRVADIRSRIGNRLPSKLPGKLPTRPTGPTPKMPSPRYPYGPTFGSGRQR